MIPAHWHQCCWNLLQQEHRALLVPHPKEVRKGAERGFGGMQQSAGGENVWLAASAPENRPGDGSTRGRPIGSRGRVLQFRPMRRAGAKFAVLAPARDSRPPMKRTYPRVTGRRSAETPEPAVKSPAGENRTPQTTLHARSHAAHPGSGSVEPRSKPAANLRTGSYPGGRKEP